MKKFLPTSRNPAKKLHEMSSIFRMIVCGASGSGKSAYITNLIARFPNHFNNIVIFTAEEEPIYDWLQSQLPDDLLRVYYNYLTPLTKCEKLSDFFWGSTLCIIDDMITKNKKELKPIMDLYVRGRKIHNGVSICFLSQSWFDVPKLIRQQINYCVLVKISNDRDLSMILSEFKLNCNKKQLQNMYNHCCLNQFGDVMMIDKQSAVQDGKTYRKNFLEYLNPNDF
jgi:hypothetical protein